MKNRINYPDQQNCAHAWAHQLTHEGYSSNFFFEGDTIYSYGSHFPIAVLDEDRVFFTTDRYSRTTAKHMSIVRSAISHKQIVYVHYLPTTRESSDQYFIDMNLDHWIGNLESLVIEYNNNKRKSSLLKQIQSIRECIERFLDQLQIKPTKKLKTILSSPTLKSIASYYKIARQKKEAAEKARTAKQLQSFMESLSDWRIFKISSISSYNPDDASLAYLRINESAECIETTKGVSIPFDVANRFYKYIQNFLKTRQSHCQYKVMSFQVLEISTEQIVVGCHKIKINEITRTASLLNW